MKASPLTNTVVHRQREGSALIRMAALVVEVAALDLQARRPQAQAMVASMSIKWAGLIINVNVGELKFCMMVAPSYLWKTL